jgi:hypothetical protein
MPRRRLLKHHVRITSMNIRRITSLTALLSFFCVLLTSVIMYIVPQGRVAYWADWRLWGLSKEQWGAIHINSGVLFLLALCLHIYYNWNPIVLYLKSKTKQLKVFTKEFNLALALTLICVVGTYVEIPPFATVIHISEAVKAAGARKYGEPPYGHAELSSLKTFAQKVDIDLEAAIVLLEQAGYQLDDENQTLKAIAQNNGVSPQQIYQAMRPATVKAPAFTDKTETLPETPAPGTGNLTLADFCSRYHLNVKVIVASLKEADITSQEDMPIKAIAEVNQISPIDVYERIKAIVATRADN